jgi:hypothetical protein
VCNALKLFAEMRPVRTLRQSLLNLLPLLFGQRALAPCR